MLKSQDCLHSPPINLRYVLTLRKPLAALDVNAENVVERYNGWWRPSPWTDLLGHHCGCCDGLPNLSARCRLLLSLVPLTVRHLYRVLVD